MGFVVVDMHNTAGGIGWEASGGYRRLGPASLMEVPGARRGCIRVEEEGSEWTPPGRIQGSWLGLMGRRLDVGGSTGGLAVPHCFARIIQPGHFKQHVHTVQFSRTAPHSYCSTVKQTGEGKVRFSIALRRAYAHPEVKGDSDSDSSTMDHAPHRD